MTNEEQFLQRINSKEAVAFRILFNEFYNSLVLFAMGYVEQQEVAEDIVQELFTKLWERDAKYTSYNGFKTFLYHSVKNLSLNYLKHREVESKYISSMALEPNVEGELDFKIMEEELYRLLFNLVEELPARCRKIFEFHLQGKGNEEIAELLNLSVFTVKTQKKRAMYCIRKRVGGIYFVLLVPHIIY